jgi:polyphosphate kinase
MKLCHNNEVVLHIMNQSKYFNRDISWLSFNYRVMQEAMDPSLPLYERIKFLAIYSNNLDEFFRVRVGVIRHSLSVAKEREEAELLLAEINGIVDNQQKEFGQVFRGSILPELEKNGIQLIMDGNFTKKQQLFIKQYYQEELIFHVQPILLVKNKVVPFLQNGAIYLLVALTSKTKKSSKPAKNVTPTSQKRRKYAILKLPSDVVKRFVELPSVNDKYSITFLDDVIRFNLPEIFKGYNIEFAHSIKMSRDADLHIEDEFQGNLVEKVKKSLGKRKIGAPSRFLYDEKMPKEAVGFLKSIFKMKKNEMIAGGRYHNFYDFFKFPNPLAPALESFPNLPLRIPEFDSFPSMFEAIKTRDWILHFPYQDYDYVLRFLNQASFDPKVFEIKATQYRVAPESGVVNALINAARNGKKVTVFVEVKARFDEESNLRFAQQMAAAGVNIIYSLPGLKVHAKAIVVSRESGNRRGVRQYAFLSTGNFNERTAKTYADHGYFTSNYEICDELTTFFQQLEKRTDQAKFNQLLVAQYNMVTSLYKMIDQEIQHAKQGKKAQIIIKVNNLEEESMIDKLYEASKAGVIIDIIVRGICRVIPNKKFSQNIRIRRIVDQYLEHARLCIFYNGGKQDVFLSSADWMSRNLFHRIELGFPINEPDLKKEILDIVHLQLIDNTKARIIDEHLKNNHLPHVGIPHRSQTETYEYLRNKYYKVFADD